MSESGPVPFYAASLARNLLAGLRLALFLPVRAFDFRVSPQHFAVLMGCNFLVWIAAAALRARFSGEFDLGSVPIFLAEIALVLAAALLVALAYRVPERLLLFATALSASDPLFEAVSLALPRLAALAGYPGVAALVLLAWTWIVAVRAVMVCGGRQRPHVFLAASAVTAMIATAFYVIPQTEVWRAPEEAAAPEPLAEERIFHLQGQLIERALAAVQPGKPGTPELYFVGFAPDGSQEVFLSEMRFVRRLFDERFGTAGRSIVLVNNDASLEEFPVASATNLARALARAGEAMNADEDMLFLFITAHGYKDHRLSAVQPPLELNPLTPVALARMLHDSGIKWRVLVVSACYAGGFIEPLRDDNTLIITAAAAERTSFGCEPGREFTYFGQAYFRDSLSRTRSFTRAFDLAREIVAKEEGEEKLVPSQPQMFVGGAIGERLKKLGERPDQ